VAAEIFQIGGWGPQANWIHPSILAVIGII